MKTYKGLRRRQIETPKHIPPKSQQTCDTCKHWHKYRGNCMSPGGQCSSGMYYPAYRK